MRHIVRLFASLLVLSVAACEEEGGGGSGGGSGGGAGGGGGSLGGDIVACDLVTASFVSDLAGIALGATPTESVWVTACNYTADGVPRNASIRIEFDGAQYYDQTRAQMVESLGGTTEDVTGIGDAAFSHVYATGSGAFSATVLTLVVADGDALISANVGDTDLTGFDAEGMLEEMVMQAMTGL